MNKLTIIGFASTRSVQIAASPHSSGKIHLLSLPPHAPCRLQPANITDADLSLLFASTRSVQIAAAEMHRMHMHFLERVLSW